VLSEKIGPDVLEDIVEENSEVIEALTQETLERTIDEVVVSPQGIQNVLNFLACRSVMMCDCTFFVSFLFWDIYIFSFSFFNICSNFIFSIDTINLNQWAGDTDAESLKRRIQSLALVGPKKVCQLAFKRNDIVWICKSCQKDETCVLCNVCFRDSNHDGHEVRERWKEIESERYSRHLLFLLNLIDDISTMYGFADRPPSLPLYISQMIHTGLFLPCSSRRML
jgi:hypothetical protein